MGHPDFDEPRPPERRVIICRPRIQLTFQGAGWKLDHAPLDLDEAHELRDLLDSAIEGYVSQYGESSS